MTALPLHARIEAALSAAFVSLGLPPSAARALPSSRTELADFQCNAAMSLAREAGKPSRKVAEAIAGAMAGDPLFGSVAVAGPGFVNMVVSDAALAEAAGQPPALASGKREHVVIDFGGPNVAKALHVGHLRSLVIGESLRRTYAALGHRVTSDIHLGDWGLQMGQLISALKAERPGLPYFYPAWTGPYPDASPVTVEELQELYPRAARACVDDPGRLEAARAATASLQSGHPGYTALWKAMRDVSLRSQRDDISWLGARFDLFLGESDSNGLIAPLADRLLEDGVAVRSEGAVVVPVGDDLPPLMLVKSDGGYTYGATDLATIAMRVRDLAPDRIVYVVDQRQAAHLQAVFRASDKAGIMPADRLVHVGFGTVNGPDGKPLKTRAGGTARLSELLADAEAKAAERLSGREGSEGDARLARQVAAAALKFGDLQGNRLSGYDFDLDRLVSFEGRTGPYLQYACVRIRSIAARWKGEPGEAPVSVAHPAERALALECLGLPEAVAAAGERAEPGIVAAKAFAVAQAFSRFYAECPVLAGGDAAPGRVSLCMLAYRTLSTCLDLLGIEVPERM